MKLSIRLTLAMVALVAGTAIVTLFFANRALESIVESRALLRVEAHARLLASKLEDDINDVRADVLSLKSIAAINELIRARINGGQNYVDDAFNKPAHERLAQFFEGQLSTKPAYLQFSIIGIDDGGREIVRVDRSGPDEAIRIVPNSELQRRGDTDYFQEAIKLKPGQAFISRIQFNREIDPGGIPQVPVLRLATPIQAPNGLPFGVIVVSFDVRPMFEAIRSIVRDGESITARPEDSEISPGNHVYVVNDSGDYLVHPDRAHEFGFEFGLPSRITDDLPEVAAFLGTDQPHSRMLSDVAGTGFGAAMAPVRLARDFWIGVLEIVPNAEIMAPVTTVQQSTMLSGLVAMLAAVALAVLFARSIAKPLVQLTSAIKTFAPGTPLIIPAGALKGSGEIRVLARTFERMADEVSKKAAGLKLESEKREGVFAQLRDTYARQDAIFSHAIDGIVTLDECGAIETLNPAAMRMFGCNTDVAVRRDIGLLMELGQQNDISSAVHLRKLLTNGTAICQLVGRRGDGSVFPIEVLLTEMIVSHRQMFVMFVRDTTARKIAEEKFRLAVEACPSGMVMIDASGKILLVNAETEGLFQYQREELIEQPVEILVPSRFRAEHPQHRTGYRDDPHAHARPMGKGRELFGLRKDGTEFPVEIGLNPIRMRDGSVVTLAAINDISERKRNDQLKDEFVAMVSHELRTPLTSIAASLGLLVADPAGTLSDPAKRLLRIAHSNSQRLVRLINDILDMEKIESGKVELHMSRINVPAFLEQVIDSNRGLADQFEVTLRLDPESIDAVVRADIDRLTQVVTNLLSNAVKFSPRGGEVLVTIEGIGTRVRIGVRDHGSGIPEEFKSRIFEKFAQADSSDTRQKGGTGLGLNIVKQIVGRLGGQTGFDAAPGGGTIFYVDLPRHDAELMAAFDRADGAQILLCADDAVAAALLCEQLHQAQFNVDVAFTVEEAVRGSASRPYAAIVVDLQLPDSDGIALIKQLRSQWHYQNTPVVAVSADPKHSQSEERGSIFNALDWLRKPLDVERLVRVLNRPIIRDEHPRPRVLHFDGDRDVLRLVADALKASADVFSADTIDMARGALAKHVFDHAVIEVNLAGGEFGIDLLPDLRDKNGHPIPAIMYSDTDRPEIAAGVLVALAKSPTSIQALVAMLCRLVAGRPARAPMIKEVA